MTVPLRRLLPVGLEGGRVEGEGDVLLGDAAGVDRHARVVVSVLLLQVDHRQVEPSLLTAWKLSEIKNDVYGKFWSCPEHNLPYEQLMEFSANEQCEVVKGERTPPTPPPPPPSGRLCSLRKNAARHVCTVPGTPTDELSSVEKSPPALAGILEKTLSPELWFGLILRPGVNSYKGVLFLPVFSWQSYQPQRHLPLPCPVLRPTFPILVDLLFSSHQYWIVSFPIHVVKLKDEYVLLETWRVIEVRYIFCTSRFLCNASERMSSC